MAEHRRETFCGVELGAAVEHQGEFVWANGAELVWLCAEDCEHPSHEEKCSDCRIAQEVDGVPNCTNCLREWLGGDDA